MKNAPVNLIICVVLVWLLSGFFLYGIEDRGTFGDMFGAINSLFSGLAFAGVVYAILLQQKEIMIQKEELALTRKEHKKTADAAEKQISFVESQRKREDLYRLISKLADRVNNNYNSNFLENGVSLQKVLKGSRNANENKELGLLHESCQYLESNNAILVRYIETDLIRLSKLIKAYETDDCDGHVFNPISDFYKQEFGDLVKCLYQYNLIKGADLDLYM